MFSEVEVPYVDMPEMDDSARFLEKDSESTQGVGSVDPGRTEIWRQYQDEFATLKLSAPRSSLEIDKIGRNLLSSNVVLRISLGQT